MLVSMSTKIHTRAGSKLAEYVEAKTIEATLGQEGTTVDVLRGLRRLNEANEDANDETIAQDKCMRKALDWISSNFE